MSESLNGIKGSTGGFTREQIIEPLLVEQAVAGRRGYRFSAGDVPCAGELPAVFRRNTAARLPEASELDTVRHFSRLSTMTFGVDYGFYPLGSCTMKYNPKVNEYAAGLEGFTDIHPLQDEDTVQGCLELLYKTTETLSELLGMTWGTLQGCAGAHGEYTGLKVIRTYFLSRKEAGRNKILIPVSAHGTNPASANVNGFEVVEVATDERGLVDIEDLRGKLDESVAGIMLTNPNTLGLFEKDIKTIAALVHGAGGLLYYDGANFNALMGMARPGDMGFDVVHLNLHKTFSTPHGGGGPGSGPILVKEKLVAYLPEPDIVFNRETGKYAFKWNSGTSCGKVSGFWGNFLVIVKGYTYILSMGADGLTAASRFAVLNANYMQAILGKFLDVAYKGICKHEFVLSLARLKEETGVSALDIAKGMIDRGFHPPTMYFPMIVHEALMFEPTESESKETLDEVCRAIEELAGLARSNPEVLHRAPCHAGTTRVDEVQAAKYPVVRY